MSIPEPALVPPVELMVRRARRRLDRLAPAQVPAELARGAALIDIRSEVQRARDGELPDAVPVPRNVLEWRCDQHSPSRDELLCGRRLIVICDEGCQSSLAAAALQELGRTAATDVIDGFRGWVATGLPVVRASLSPAQAPDRALRVAGRTAPVQPTR